MRSAYITVRRVSASLSLALIALGGLPSIPSYAGTTGMTYAETVATWTVAMPDATQPISTPSGGTLGVACYSTTSFLSPLVDLAQDGETTWSVPASASADPCPATAIAASDGRVYAVISTSAGSALRAYGPFGSVKWTAPLDGGPSRTDRIAVGWNGSVFLQLTDGRQTLVEGLSESSGNRTFDVSEYDGDGIYPYSGGIALAQPEGVEYFSYHGTETASVQLPALSAYEAYSAAGGSSGTVFLAGWADSCGSNKFSVSKVTPNGLAWTKTDSGQTVCGQTSLV